MVTFVLFIAFRLLSLGSSQRADVFTDSNPQVVSDEDVQPCFDEDLFLSDCGLNSVPAVSLLQRRATVIRGASQHNAEDEKEDLRFLRLSSGFNVTGHGYLKVLTSSAAIPMSNLVVFSVYFLLYSLAACVRSYNQVLSKLPGFVERLMSCTVSTMSCAPMLCATFFAVERHVVIPEVIKLQMRREHFRMLVCLCALLFVMQAFFFFLGELCICNKLKRRNVFHILSYICGILMVIGLLPIVASMYWSEVSFPTGEICSVALTMAYFAVYSASHIINTLEVPTLEVQAPVQQSSWKAVVTMLASTLHLAPMICIIFLASESTIFELVGDHGALPSIATFWMFMCTVLIFVMSAVVLCSRVEPESAGASFAVGSQRMRSKLRIMIHRAHDLLSSSAACELDSMGGAANLLLRTSFPGHNSASQVANPYCVCLVLGKPHTRVQTQVQHDTAEPVWNETHVVDDYSYGDLLEFTVMNKEDNQRNPDILLGRVVLTSPQFYPNGYDGALALVSSAGGNPTIGVSITCDASPVSRTALHDTFRPAWNTLRWLIQTALYLSILGLLISLTSMQPALRDFRRIMPMDLLGILAVSYFGVYGLSWMFISFTLMTGISCGQQILSALKDTIVAIPMLFMLFIMSLSCIRKHRDTEVESIVQACMFATTYAQIILLILSITVGSCCQCLARLPVSSLWARVEEARSINDDVMRSSRRQSSVAWILSGFVHLLFHSATLTIYFGAIVILLGTWKLTLLQWPQLRP